MRDTLLDVERLAARASHVLVATADASGWPHVAAAGRLVITPENHALVTEWFCPGTVKNLQVNPRVAVVVWAPDTDTGYQMLCELESVKDIGVLDGYTASQPAEPPAPQVERQLLLHIDRIIEFRKSPHTDVVQSEGSASK